MSSDLLADLRYPMPTQISSPDLFGPAQAHTHTDGYAKQNKMYFSLMYFNIKIIYSNYGDHLFCLSYSIILT